MHSRLQSWIVAGAMLLVVGSPVFGGEPLRDPTRPPATGSGKTIQDGQNPLKWRLTATIIGPERRVAVINDRALQIGQNIDGAVLVAVEAGSARLVHGGREMQLRLHEMAVKRTVRKTP
ncbi:hypothetical protein DSCW_21860 [Desulfosarcina widdelii]|uniref:MSHA biogenesis protein MshK n=1 Tax=Desulfosarcina widdelii TaxID=947919 RepID=A0A5K7Z3C9_9BACT|nr:hypothetical protein [Desulfosarcina widdelii]BBO74769.1 hypothetical protein DSCW_21860 [Desulfosarcina widdelii]